MDMINARLINWMATARERVTDERGALSLEWVGLVVVLILVLAVLLQNAEGWGDGINNVVTDWIEGLGG